MKDKMPADIVISNPPFGRYYMQGKNDPQHSGLGDLSLEFLIKIIDALKPNGQAAVLLPEGVFYRSVNSRNVLEYLLAECYLELVIHLPYVDFPNTNLHDTGLYLFTKKSLDNNKERQKSIAIYDARTGVSMVESSNILASEFLVRLRELSGEQDTAQLAQFLGEKMARFSYRNVSDVINDDALRCAGGTNTQYDVDHAGDLVDISLPELQLPVGWQFKTLNDVVERIVSGKSYKHEKRQPLGGEAGLLKTSAISRGELKPQETKVIVDTATIKKEHYLKQGDLLLCRANSPEYVGASVLIDQLDTKLVLSDKVWRIQAKNGYKHWVYVFLNTRYGRTILRDIANGIFGSMRNIRQDNFLKLQIPLPDDVVSMQYFDDTCQQLDIAWVRVADVNDMLSRINSQLLEKQQQNLELF